MLLKPLEPAVIVCPDDIVTLVLDEGTLPEAQFEGVSHCPSPLEFVKVSDDSLKT